ncbi:MAG TPA: nucleoside 2-deoxyribosyltransferase [Thermoanaerobaculia bacterium]|nr:nucleoside 2-deoxyribosyltransferase [Thermoanaerobaculia bacterium]
MTTLIYIASPLSCESERKFNLQVRSFVSAHGLDTYLPQEDGGLLSDLVRQTNSDEELLRQKLFASDVGAVRRCDALLAVLDGRVVDEGVCVELGMAFTLGKTCIGFKTDSRAPIRGRDNLMVEGSLEEIARNWEELDSLLTRLKENFECVR